MGEKNLEQRLLALSPDNPIGGVGGGVVGGWGRGGNTTHTHPPPPRPPPGIIVGKTYETTPARLGIVPKYAGLLLIRH